MPQVSPANTYVGLTTNEPGSAPGEPQKYYPKGDRTYLRIVPRDTIQAAAGLITMKKDGCTKVAVANDKEAYGTGLAALLELQKGKYGVNIVSNTGIDPTQPNFRSYASTIKGQGADCFYFAGIVSNGAVQITKDVNAAIPNAKIYGGDGVCTSSYTAASQHGVPASIDPKIQCTVATLDLPTYPGGKDFLAAYKKAYGSANPDPYAIYGYEAMKLGLDTISVARCPGQRQGRRAQGPVRDQGASFGARDLRVRRQRRHDAEVVRPVQGRQEWHPRVRAYGHAVIENAVRSGVACWRLRSVRVPFAPLGSQLTRA